MSIYMFLLTKAGTFFSRKSYISSSGFGVTECSSLGLGVYSELENPTALSHCQLGTAYRDTIYTILY